MVKISVSDYFITKSILGGTAARGNKQGGLCAECEYSRRLNMLGVRFAPSARTRVRALRLCERLE